MADITGAGTLIAKDAPAEVPPPGTGFTIVTVAVAAAATSAAAIAAVSEVALTKVVARFAPFHCTVEVPAKPVPFTVSVNAAAPAVAMAGESVPIAGVGLLMANAAPADVPPPGAGFTIVTVAVPAVARSVAEIAAVTWFKLTSDVNRLAPFHCTCDAALNPLPVTVSVIAPEPALEDAGSTEAMAGTGFELIANDTPGDVPPPGPELTTVVTAVPVTARSAAVAVKVNWLALKKVVARFTPFHCRTDPATNPLPVTVTGNAADPVAAENGVSAPIAGAGLFTVNVAVEEIPPPGAGFATVTAMAPPLAMSAAEMSAVSCVALTKVVERVVPFH